MPRIIKKTKEQLEAQKRNEEIILRALGKLKDPVAKQATIFSSSPVEVRVRPPQEDLFEPLQKKIADLESKVASKDKETVDLRKSKNELVDKLQEFSAMVTKNNGLTNTIMTLRHDMELKEKQSSSLRENIEQLRHALKGDADHSNCKRAQDITEQHLNRTRSERDKANWFVLILALLHGFVFITIAVQFVLRYLL